MATFKFRLEKVWRHRRRVVDQHSVAVAQVNRKVASLSCQIVELESTIARHARTLVPKEGETRRPRDFVSGAAWQDHLHHLRKELDDQLQLAVMDLERSRARLTASWRDLEVLSRLRERQNESWHVDQETRLRKEMDEIGQVRAFRHRATKDSL